MYQVTSFHQQRPPTRVEDDNIRKRLEQEAEVIWRRLHRMTRHTLHAAHTARAAADLSGVTDRQTDRQTPRLSVTIGGISCLRLSLVKCQ